ncbi:alpha/beta hydrolase family protein [Ferrimonas balearica]|uniref:alpha/beta hydrolase family protein n=1 Tax=Ferrimonas balearica TaxID=44012 RepID=UPI001C9955B4|nr:prolyl oligopeptidase family serine peptidase [Ferrimonas balearica]MBY5921657.1 prolyl oligopeptidase family serine peptidase [Ferrimonas balearica]MBY5995003.1 prolyl oligopeptidase family serine peptidase [Ferrimonas balearica]
MAFRSFSLLIVSLVGLLLPLSATAATKAPLPVTAYGKLPHMSDMELSPDGRYLSMLRNVEGHLVLAVTDLTTGDTEWLFKADNLEVTLNWYTWANNDTLLFGVGSTKWRTGVKYTHTQLYKITMGEDSEPKVAVRPKSSKGYTPQFLDRVIHFLPDQPDHILLSADFDRPGLPSVYKVNIMRGTYTLEYRARSHIHHWVTDEQARVRIGIGRDDTRAFFRLMDIEGNFVRNLWEFELLEAPDIRILGFDKNPDILYIRAEHEGRYGVFKVDLSDPELKRELLLSDPTYDMTGYLIYSAKSGEVVGFSGGWTYWDDEYLKLQTALNSALPDANNQIVSVSNDLTQYVLYTRSAEFTGDYLLGNRKTGTLDYLGSQYPMVDESQYAGKVKLHFKARDGLAIEGYLTRPKGAPVDTPLPTIILPHGGPMSHDTASFDYWSAWLANRGYAVFQPNFRGSTGYGFEFAMKSIGDWGGAMQDDLEDAARFLVKEGVSDARRICIGGGSYGGYAALMAAVKQTDTFRCAASIAGVTDLQGILNNARRFTHYEVIKRQLGSQLDQRSPLRQASRVGIPVLLIHGSDDKVVPVAQSRAMANALKAADKAVTYIELEHGNHSLSAEAHRLQAMSAMAEFFDKHLKM